ncbi:poly(A)-specific ribonuclease PARN-like isoform X2 [Apostichopus japonicus]|uniref:poly(A)-specific ribonuclease PARN-like isoform X2 n=1 Tax=Stichopus japonicus TaxID=307972 RepID=UPI003AB5D7D6
MEVTRHNFKEGCQLLSQALENASFVAIDGEFTGLHGIHKPNQFDSLEERYQKLRTGSMDFLLVQFGLCVFKYDGAKSRYTAYPFNFYVFPRPVNRHAPDIRFRCQSSSIDFLASHNFDFNKVFRDGIPFLTNMEQERLKDLVLERHSQSEVAYNPVGGTGKSPKFVSPATNKAPVDVPEEEKEFLEGICNDVEKFLPDKKKANLSLPPCNGFKRKLIYQTIYAKWPTGVHLESHPVEKSRLQSICVNRASQEEKKKLDKQKLQNAMDEVEEAAGFAKVIQMLSSSKRTIVGHNMMLDLMHTLHQFSGTLPETLAEFKSMTNAVFNKIFDTKVLATAHPIKDLIPFSSLAELKYLCHQEPFRVPHTVTAQKFPEYTLHNEQLHEAGYDAFVTGICFATMANYLGSLVKTPPKGGRVSPTSQLMEPFMNKLAVHMISELPYLNLIGLDLSPDRSHLFHVTFPKEWRSSDLHHLFSSVGPVQISWKDDCSAFVALSRKDMARNVLDIPTSPSYVIMPYNKYKEICEYVSEPFQAQEVAPIRQSEPPSELTSKGLKRSHDSLEEVMGPDEEVAELTEREAKKQKPMNPNAAPFVSRKSITPPDPGSNPDEPKIKILKRPANDAARQNPEKLFDEPAEW